MMTALLQLDFNESEAARIDLSCYIEKQGEAYSRYIGIAEYIPPPVDTLMGRLLLYLYHLSACGSSYYEQIFWRSSSLEAWMAMHWLIKKEWLDSYELPPFLEDVEKTTRNKKEISKAKSDIEKAKKDTEQLGDVFKALLHLCEKSATLATLAHLGHYPEYIGGARLFSEIVIEIAHYGGLENLLQLLYEPEIEKITQKKALSRKLLTIVKRIENNVGAGELPCNTHLFIGKLIDHAVSRAALSDSYREGPFATFIAALRSYVSSIESKDCGMVTLRKSRKGDLNWEISQGKNKGFQRLPPITCSQQGLQSAMAKC